jgi:glutamate racemase
MDNRPIGVYDSGIGGLTVFSKLVKVLPNENYLYFGDTANIPYGTKSKEELLIITHKIMNFFKEQNVKAVVMACNTTSALVYEELKKDYDFILYPVIQTVCKIISQMGYSKIGTLSTEATALSHAYKNQLSKYNTNCQIFEHGCPKTWVEIVENNSQNDKSNENVLLEHLKKVTAENVEKIILGCTHYPYLKDVLTKLNGEDIFIDPSQYFVEYIKNDLIEKDLLAEKKFSNPKFFVSDNPEKFMKSSAIFYQINEKPYIIN